MKNKTIFVAFAVLIAFMLIIPLVNADIIAPGTKVVPYCAKFVNLGDYPDYVFLLYNDGPAYSMAYSMISVIGNNVCLDLGYKFSTNFVYAIEKSEYESKGYVNLTRPFELYFQKDYNISADENLINLNYQLGKEKTYISVYKSSPLRSVDTTLKVESINGKLSVSESIKKNYSFFAPWLILMFLMTFVIELFIVWAFVKGNFLKAVLWVFIINLITWSIANLGIAFGAGWAIAESFVFLAEGFLIMRLLKVSWKRAFLASFVANLTSALIGLILAIFI